MIINFLIKNLTSIQETFHHPPWGCDPACGAVPGILPFTGNRGPCGGSHSFRSPVPEEPLSDVRTGRIPAS